MQMIKEGSTYQGRRYEQKREKKGEKKLSIKKHNIPSFGLRGLSHKKKKQNYQKGGICRKISKVTVYEIGMSIVFEPIPEKN
jgi:hypothetical protein